MRRLCVFCGSNKGTKATYSSATYDLGYELAKQQITLVYGGGNVGLMGILADAVLESGGEVIGVIPETLVAKEVAHKGVTELKIIKSMHERKATMADLSDAFIALPGGFGTFEEFFEVVTWTQLGLHKKPCGLLNIDNFFAPILSLIGHATKEGFIRKEHVNIIISADSSIEILKQLKTWQPPKIEKWLEKSKR